MKPNYISTIPIFLIVGMCLLGCTQKRKLKPITVKDFARFVAATGYQTDAEKFGWSFVQKTILKADIVEGANWRVPNAIDSAALNFPVTQVSYHDAMAYCNWANAELPDYTEYWEYVQDDPRKVIKGAQNMSAIENVNIVGNAWDITKTKNFKDEIRLAGGSYLCDHTTCDGTNPNRKLYVSKDTGNSNISFSVLKK